MENEELTDDLEVEQTDETVEENETAEQEQTQDTTTPTVEQRLAKAEAEAAKFRRLFEKAKGGNAPTTVEATTPSHAPSAVDVEETVLKAQGMPQELLTTLKKVAQVEGSGLIEAQASALFVAAKTQFEKEEKSKAASVGASRGSGRVENRKSLVTPNLSREEHMKLVKG